MKSEEAPTPRERARAAIDGLLYDGLGIRIVPDALVALSDWGRRESALSLSLRLMFGMGLVFCAFPIAFGLYSPTLLTLAIYGVLWSGWSAGTSVLTSRIVQGIIERQILPRLPDQVCLDLAGDIERRFPKWWRLLVTWGVGCAAATISALLVYGDRGNTTAWATIAFQWWPEWLILFAAAASVVQVSTFYRLLPRHIAAALIQSPRLDPANAALVQAMASVARVILVFWLGIGLSVAILLPASGLHWQAIFGAIPPGSMHELYASLTRDPDPVPRFVLVEVPVTCFFSLGFGVIVFLFTEADLRAASREARLATLEGIEAEAGALLARLGTLDDAGMKRLTELRALQAGIAAVTPYRSIVVSALSVLLPFIPLASFLLPFL